MNGRIEHTIPPVYDAGSRILILGTMPSPKSRELGFYYAHPQNRFWPVMAALFGRPQPRGRDEKTKFLLETRIALWDVLESCTIDGADDSSIKNPAVNDFSPIFQKADIRRVFTTGKKATGLYRKYCLPKTGRPSVYLPSTSPANRGRYPLEALIRAYAVILNDLKP